MNGIPKIKLDNLNMEVFGKNIHRYRKENKLTQEELAKMAGIRQGTLSKIEQGKIYITSRVELALAKALGVAVSDLWKEELNH